MRHKEKDQHPPQVAGLSFALINKGKTVLLIKFGSGRGIRTPDLRVMSPTSWPLLHPATRIINLAQTKENSLSSSRNYQS